MFGREAVSPRVTPPGQAHKVVSSQQPHSHLLAANVSFDDSNMASRGSHHCRINAGALKQMTLREPRAGFNSRPLLFSDREPLDGVSGVKCQQHHYGVNVPPSSRATKQAQTRVKKNTAPNKAAFRARSVRNSRPGSALLGWMLTSTTLQKAGSTSVRLKQWDEERRRCALFWL